MNIQFNYFVIRYLSNKMGFNDKVSQIIACASQFIEESNDGSENSAVSFVKEELEGKKINQYMNLFKNDGEKLKLYIPKTIQKDFKEFDDFDYFKTEHICWQGIVPFHYPPLYPLDCKDEQMVNYQVEAPENFYSRKVFDDLTSYAIEQYRNNENQDTIEETAIRIGAISHMIADSYAHINLNGFVSETVNNVEVTQVMNGDTASYITDKYVVTEEEKAILPFVGQYRMKNILDECYLIVNFIQDGFTVPHNNIVNTLDSCMEAAKCIYKFFLELLGKTDDKYSIWEGTYKPVIEEMLSFRDTNIDELTQKWSKKCSGITFNYKKNKENPDYLFGAAIVAEDIRKAVVTPEEKDKFYEMTKVKGSISFSSIKFENDEFIVSATATEEDTDIPRMLCMNLFNDRKQLLLSKNFGLEDGGNSIKGEIRNKVPKNKTGYKLNAALYTESDPDSIAYNKSIEITFEDSSSLIKCIKNNLTKAGSEEVDVLYNMDDENNDKLCFLNNADYFNQDNNHVIDILLPLIAEFEIDTKYKFNSVKPYLFLTDGNNNFIHCGNDKLNNITFNQDKSTCILEFNEIWKNYIPLEIYHHKELDLDLKISLDVTIDVKEDSGLVGSRKFTWEPNDNIFPTIKMKWKEDAKKR